VLDNLGGESAKLENKARVFRFGEQTEPGLGEGSRGSSSVCRSALPLGRGRRQRDRQ
jgi:hypothetical protein